MKRTEFRGAIGGAALDKDQSHDMEIKDLAGLSKPLTRLIEVTAQGIGAVSRPYLTRRDADAEAYKIQKIADAIKGVEEQNQLPVVYDGGKIEIWQKPEDRTLILGETTLDERAHSRADFKERKRQANLESITSAAAAELVDEEDVPDEHPDEDWVTRFFDCAQDVSSAQMQQIWGRLLAGEIKTPGSFSLRTLEFIRNLSPNEASLIDRVFRFVILPGDSRENACLFAGGNVLEETAGIGYADILRVADLGLVNSTKLQDTYTISRASGGIHLTQGNYALMIKIKINKNEAKIPIAVYRIGIIGIEILNLLKRGADLNYLKAIGLEVIKNLNFTAEIIVIKERISQGVIRYETIQSVSNEL